ncbi:uncharacterized protein LOC106876466 isoform X2 [Octopus bimaculoides]|uniref:uncharacterized protein LOC106876466 isoform X2 n=1 Tax=Octopus bimaculoides TaxID=37653 RepID=UPI0022E58773|nr:uncharacterized protein LOC106876466 isoform X2 [Octopus bimaculoides]
MASSKKNSNHRMEDTSDVVKTGYLKKLKTMKKKFFVLRGNSNSGPARLEYYDSEKKYRSYSVPKRSIELNSCFNINKKIDPKHKHAVSLFTKDDCFSIVAENAEEQDAWLDCLLDLQNTPYHFEYVWQVTVKPKDLGATKNMTGQFRLCLTNHEISLVRLNSEIPEVTFQLGYIRRCGHRDCLFFMEVGRLAPTGHGELWMQVEDQATARNMHDCILGEMKMPISSSDSGNFRNRSSSSSGKTVVMPTWSNNEHSSESISMFGSDQFQFNRSRTVSEGQQLSHYDYYPHVGHRLRSDSTESHGSRSSYSAESCASSPAVEIPIGSYRCRSSVPTPDSLRGSYIEDYVPMHPGDQSSTPSTPEQYGSAGSNWGETGQFENYINFQPSASTTASEMTDSYDACMDLSPGSQKSERDYGGDVSSYVMMEPGKAVSVPQQTPQQQQQQQQLSPQASSPVNDAPYVDMGPTGTSLPTVKESGSPEEHYLQMTPPGHSPKGSSSLRPNRGHSYLISDETISVEKDIPKRSYSVGCKPQPKTVLKPQGCDAKLAMLGMMDNSRCSSAPHLISQKQKSSNTSSNHSLPSNSPPCGSYKSEDSDFSELEFGRPRTASDSYGCRPRASSLGKSLTQGHRPRSSSHSSRCFKRSSFESVRTTSEELLRKMSQESLQKDPYSLAFLPGPDGTHWKYHSKKNNDAIEMGKNKGSMSKSFHAHLPVSSMSNTGGEMSTYLEMTGFSSSPKHSPVCDVINMKTNSPVMSMSLGEYSSCQCYPFDKYYGQRKTDHSLKPGPVPDKVVSHIKSNSDDESDSGSNSWHKDVDRYVPCTHSGFSERLSLRSKTERVPSDLGVRRTKSVSHDNRSQALATLRKQESAGDPYFNMDFPKPIRPPYDESNISCPSYGLRNHKEKPSDVEDAYIELSYNASNAMKKYDNDTLSKKVNDSCTSRKEKFDSDIILGKSDAKRPQSMFSSNFDPFFSNSFPFNCEKAKAAEIEPYVVFDPRQQYRHEPSSAPCTVPSGIEYIQSLSTSCNDNLQSTKRCNRDTMKVIHKRHSSMPVKTDLYSPPAASSFAQYTAPSIDSCKTTSTSLHAKSASTSTSPISCPTETENAEYFNLSFGQAPGRNEKPLNPMSWSNCHEEQTYKKPLRQSSWLVDTDEISSSEKESTRLGNPNPVLSQEKLSEVPKNVSETGSDESRQEDRNVNQCSEMMSNMKILDQSNHTAENSESFVNVERRPSKKSDGECFRSSKSDSHSSEQSFMTKNNSCSSIASDSAQPKKSESLGLQGRHSYTEVCLIPPITGNPLSSLKHSSSCETELNYASLELSSTETLTECSDLHQKSPNSIKSRHSSGAEEKSVSPLTYVEIDFPKTESLQRQNSNQEVKFTL